MKKYEGIILSEDETCSIVCVCDPTFDNKPLDIYGGIRVTRCPRCGRGYRAEMVVWQYEADEDDEED
jgi:hypothetical protein